MIFHFEMQEQAIQPMYDKNNKEHAAFVNTVNHTFSSRVFWIYHPKNKRPGTSPQFESKCRLLGTRQTYSRSRQGQE